MALSIASVLSFFDCLYLTPSFFRSGVRIFDNISFLHMPTGAVVSSSRQLPSARAEVHFAHLLLAITHVPPVVLVFTRFMIVMSQFTRLISVQDYVVMGIL